MTITIPKTDEELAARATAYADAHVAKLREALESGSTLESLQLADNEAPVEGVLAREHDTAVRKERDTLAALMRIGPPFHGPSTHYTVTISVPDLLAAAEAGMKFKLHTESDYQRAELIMFTDDKIDLAYGLRILMEVADTYYCSDATFSRLTVPEDERLDYDGLLATDSRFDGCGDPRVIIRELMRMFGDEQIRDLVNERIEAMKSGVTYSIHEANALQQPKIVKIVTSSLHEPAE